MTLLNSRYTNLLNLQKHSDIYKREEKTKRHYLVIFLHTLTILDYE